MLPKWIMPKCMLRAQTIVEPVRAKNFRRLYVERHACQQDARPDQQISGFPGKLKQLRHGIPPSELGKQARFWVLESVSSLRIGTNGKIPSCGLFSSLRSWIAVAVAK